MNNRNQKNKSMLSLGQEDIDNNHVKINTARMVDSHTNSMEDKDVTNMVARGISGSKHPYESLQVKKSAASNNQSEKYN